MGLGKGDAGDKPSNRNEGIKVENPSVSSEEQPQCHEISKKKNISFEVAKRRPRMTDDERRSMRELARRQWLEITRSTDPTIKNDGQESLALVLCVICDRCEALSSEISCYAYLDRFLCEECCGEIAEFGGW